MKHVWAFISIYRLFDAVCLDDIWNILYDVYTITHNLSRWASIVNFYAWRYLLFVVEVITHTRHKHTHKRIHDQGICTTDINDCYADSLRYHVHEIFISSFPFSFRCFNRLQTKLSMKTDCDSRLNEKLRSDWNNFVSSTLWFDDSQETRNILSMSFSLTKPYVLIICHNETREAVSVFNLFGVIGNLTRKRSLPKFA